MASTVTYCKRYTLKKTFALLYLDTYDKKSMSCVCMYMTVVVGIDPYWHTQLLSCKELLHCSLIRHPFISCDFTVSSNFSLEMNILFRWLFFL